VTDSRQARNLDRQRRAHVSDAQSTHGCVRRAALVGRHASTIPRSIGLAACGDSRALASLFAAGRHLPLAVVCCRFGATGSSAPIAGPHRVNAAGTARARQTRSNPRLRERSPDNLDAPSWMLHWGSSVRPSPASRARTIASDRPSTWSLWYRLWTWFRTVLGLRNRAAAMSLLF